MSSLYFLVELKYLKHKFFDIKFEKFLGEEPASTLVPSLVPV